MKNRKSKCYLVVNSERGRGSIYGVCVGIYDTLKLAVWNSRGRGDNYKLIISPRRPKVGQIITRSFIFGGAR